MEKLDLKGGFAFVFHIFSYHLLQIYFSATMDEIMSVVDVDHRENVVFEETVPVDRYVFVVY